MKSVLITGTSKGLGNALLKEFLKQGWKVFALARNIRSFSDQTNQFSKTCIPVESDITEENCSAIIAQTLKSEGECLDLLINNAGNAEKKFGINNIKPEDLENHFKVHVSGAFRVVKACIPFLKKSDNPVIINVSSRKGSIHNISSGQYRILFPYQLAKASQNMLTACLNQELKEDNIKSFSIHPGNLKTDVAPPDADTEPEYAAKKIYNWILDCYNLPTNKFYNISNDSIIKW